MCGIAGIVHFDGVEIDPLLLDRMTDTLSHRGPDGRGTYIDRAVGLGHRRLSIIDLSIAASQPMTSQDGRYTLVFNGEIYNFQEERRHLEGRGYSFRSSSDTEVLLSLYQEYGEKCLERIQGMFAFAIYDKTLQRLFLARDRVGKKPLKYFLHNGVFAFASELKALKVLPECPRKIDQEALYHYLTLMYLPSPRTGVVGIEKLPAGHCMTVDIQSGTIVQRKYWELRYTPLHQSLQTWKEQVRSTFFAAVQRRMVADVPVGAFLSGGLDSAAVVWAMTELGKSPVETFSIGTSIATHDELPYAAMTAKKFATNHHPIIVEPNIVELLPELVRTYEEPYADPSLIPMYLLAREARRSVTVALNGDGGDENFCGYARYPILRFSRLWECMPGVFHSLAGTVTTLFHRCAQNTLSYRSERFQKTIKLPWSERYLQYISFFTEDEKQSFFQSKHPRTDQYYAARTALARLHASDDIHRAMAMDIATYLADDLLPKVDLGTMAYGLEVRSPFLDTSLLELTARMPLEYKLRGFQRKWILRELLKDVLPKEILNKPKTGFRLPLDTWFRGSLKFFVHDRLLSNNSPLLQICDRQGIETFLREYYASSIDYSDHVWSLLWLDEWLRQYN